MLLQEACIKVSFSKKCNKNQRLTSFLLAAKTQGTRPTVQTLATDTGIRTEDVISTLQFLGFLKHMRGTFVLAVTLERVQKHLAQFLQRNFANGFCDPSKII